MLALVLVVALIVRPHKVAQEASTHRLGSWPGVIRG
jgi:hypothetical protein